MFGGIDSKAFDFASAKLVASSKYFFLSSSTSSSLAK